MHSRVNTHTNTPPHYKGHLICIMHVIRVIVYQCRRSIIFSVGCTHQSVVDWCEKALRDILLHTREASVFAGGWNLRILIGGFALGFFQFRHGPLFCVFFSPVILENWWLILPFFTATGEYTATALYLASAPPPELMEIIMVLQKRGAGAGLDDLCEGWALKITSRSVNK